ncbi:integrase arm-type DNA-binding domain-containing protein [Xanthomonas citri]|uniref:tyrosine-type recombinase/integrase n=1 Tax=Xanthomonas citri TaxID=346 RepID=UPI0005423EFA|nr:integrase arm-type DNA-binding domain-containing protein [Xanthomonas citri]ATS69624.1 integrase arm-type DNA-binding domain-containing protein [Xanthomonas citri pv. phaseoli var. fuscans]KHF75209.1 integrase [Xanthomonas citri pv. fuscans]QTL00665.1 integrase arm-type DNA-binding domain-containing protein [Xanthomonas citri pv. fuscans]
MARSIAKPLSDLLIRKAKPGDKALRDGGGLYLLIGEGGRHGWRLDYRIAGVRRTISLGVYPDVTLAAARERREEARRLVAGGIDPSAQRQATKAAAGERAANSFEVVAREWLGKQKWVESYRVKVIAWMGNDVFPWIGSRPVAQLTAPEFLKVALRIEERGAVESAHRIMQNCGQVMRYAIATGRADRNPVADLRGALASPQGRHHAAIIDPKEVGALLWAIDAYTGDATTRAALGLAPLLFVRPGELRHAEWSEIDLDRAEWNIPAEKMKMRQPHLVPLCSQAVAILRELHPLTGHLQYVFKGGTSPRRPLSNNALTAALRRMGYDGNTMTIHGFRATARTLLDETLGYRPDFIEHQLAHAVRDPNGRAYNRTAHLAERRKMMQGWADYLDGLRADTGAVVVPFKPKAA